MPMQRRSRSSSEETKSCPSGAYGPKRCISYMDAKPFYVTRCLVRLLFDLLHTVHTYIRRICFSVSSMGGHGERGCEVSFLLVSQSKYDLKGMQRC